MCAYIFLLYPPHATDDVGLTLLQKLLFQVKWQGYEDPSDQTMEPEENL